MNSCLLWLDESVRLLEMTTVFVRAFVVGFFNVPVVGFFPFHVKNCTDGGSERKPSSATDIARRPFCPLK
jgi:hypothetical protein